ncbi:MAG: hypothetical protein QNK04_01070 [Myxococcota bacterium]|nr:hypothetical protein [Myxococcota bacterium]
MTGGLHEDISLPHEHEWELYLNALSLCSKKARVCLAELGIEYASHHVHLIETGPYENIGRVEHGHETMTRGTEGLRAAKQASPGLRAALEPV